MPIPAANRRGRRVDGYRIGCGLEAEQHAWVAIVIYWNKAA